MADKPPSDYGVDLRIDIFEDDQASGLELLVQLKASDSVSGKDTETVQLKTSTYNFLWDKLQVVMLVKYIKAENEAYWLLLRDIPAPVQSQKQFTVHIPRANRLSAAPWDQIQAHVRRVTNTKLAAMRRHQLQHGDERV